MCAEMVTAPDKIKQLWKVKRNPEENAFKF